MILKFFHWFIFTHYLPCIPWYLWVFPGIYGFRIFKFSSKSQENPWKMTGNVSGNVSGKLQFPILL